MNGKPPIPVSKTFLVCRQIFQDRRTGEYLLLGPTQDLIAPGFPAVLTLSIFSRWTSAHGVYKLEVQLQDLEGHVMWGQPQEPPLECNDPLLTSFMGLHGLQVFFPEAGKYDLVILANGEEVVSDSIYAHLASEQTT